MQKNKLISKYLNIFIFTHYAAFLTLFSFHTYPHTHTVYTHLGISKEQNTARQFIIFALLKFRSRDNGDIKQLQQQAAHALGRGNHKLAKRRAKTQNSRVAKKKYPKKQKQKKNAAVGCKKNVEQVVQKLWPKSETKPGKKNKNIRTNGHWGRGK